MQFLFVASVLLVGSARLMILCESMFKLVVIALVPSNSNGERKNVYLWNIATNDVLLKIFSSLEMLLHNYHRLYFV